MASAIMGSARIEVNALSYRDINRGRLSNIEGNPFAVLDLDVLRHARRSRKRSPTTFALARKQADSMNPIRANSSQSSFNPYEKLYVYGETTFLDLPTELRDMVYNEAIGHCQTDSLDSDAYPPRPGYCRSAVIAKGARRYTHLRNMHISMLLVNKQIGMEWRVILDKHVPVHLHTDMTFENLDGSSNRLVSNMSKAFPIETVNATAANAPAEKHDRQSEIVSTFTARGVYLEICCVTSGWGPGPDNRPPAEEDLNVHIITSAGFEDFCQRLRLCTKLEDLIVEWVRPNLDYVIHPNSRDGTLNMLFETMIQVIEAVTSLKRYFLRCGGYMMYASRPPGEAWSSDKTLRLTHDIGEVFHEAPCVQLHRDLNI